MDKNQLLRMSMFRIKKLCNTMECSEKSSFNFNNVHRPQKKKILFVTQRKCKRNEKKEEKSHTHTTLAHVKRNIKYLFSKRTNPFTQQPISYVYIHEITKLYYCCKSNQNCLYVYVHMCCAGV